MNAPLARRMLCVTVVAVLAACSAHDRSNPASPSTATTSKAPVAAVPGGSAPVAAQGAKPEGFIAVVIADPHANASGVITGGSPLTVTYDACQSKAGSGKPLTFLFDWDFNGSPDVAATGSGCVQSHTYDIRHLPASGSFSSNVCVVSGDPSTPTSPDTYYSCRSFQIAMPGLYAHDDGYGHKFFNNIPPGAYSARLAGDACQAWVRANPGAPACSGPYDCSGTPSVYTYPVVWFYGGALTGTATDAYACGIPNATWQ
jgi:hypothetical protein